MPEVVCPMCGHVRSFDEAALPDRVECERCGTQIVFQSVPATPPGPKKRPMLGILFLIAIVGGGAYYGLNSKRWRIESVLAEKIPETQHFPVRSVELESIGSDTYKGWVETDNNERLNIRVKTSPDLDGQTQIRWMVQIPEARARLDFAQMMPGMECDFDTGRIRPDSTGFGYTGTMAAKSGEKFVIIPHIDVENLQPFHFAELTPESLPLWAKNLMESTLMQTVKPFVLAPGEAFDPHPQASQVLRGVTTAADGTSLDVQVVVTLGQPLVVNGMPVMMARPVPSLGKGYEVKWKPR